MPPRTEELRLATSPLAAEGTARPQGAATEARPRAEATGKPLPAGAVIVVPVRNTVLFPGIVVPLTIGRERSLAAVQEAVRLGAPIGILLQSRAEVDDPQPGDLHWVGTTGEVLRYVTGPDGAHFAITRGQQRFRVLQFLEGWPFLVARIQRIEEADPTAPEVEGRARTLRSRALEVLRLLPQVPEETVSAFESVEGSARLADFIAGTMDIPAEEKQSLLEAFDLRARLDKLLALLSHRIEVLKVSRDIDERTRESISDANRKHLLREQMRAIRKELGEDGDEGAEGEDLAKAIAAAKMPPDVEQHARKARARPRRSAAGSSG